MDTSTGDTLLRAPGLTVTAMRCQAPLGPERDDQLARFVVPRHGAFTWRARRRGGVVGPGGVLWLAPGGRYRIEHAATAGGACLVIAFDPVLCDEPIAELPCTAFSSPPGLALHAEALVRAVPVVDALHANEIVLRYVRELAAALVSADPGPRQRTAGHAGLAERAVGFLASRYREPIPQLLDAVAAAVRCSPFHLARVFRQEVGTTVHGFRDRLRLAEALRVIASDTASLTTLAHRLGYASHSHLTDNFRRVYGVPPSAARNAFAGSPEELRRILEAVPTG